MDKINNRFSYINELPLASCVADKNTGSILMCNDLFVKLLKIYDINNIEFVKKYSPLVENKISGKPKNILSEIVHICMDNMKKIPVFSNFSDVVFNDETYTIYSFYDVDDVVLNNDFENLESMFVVKDIIDNLAVFTLVLDNDTHKTLYSNIDNANYDKAEYIKVTFFNELAKLELFNFADLENNTKSFIHEVDDNWYKFSLSSIAWINNTRAILVTAIDITEVNNSKIAVQNSIDIDPLMQIYNKTAGKRFLQDFLDRTVSEDFEFSVCMFESVLYETVLKEQGKNVADEYIVEFVGILKNSIRKTDIYAKLDDNKFIIMFPMCKFTVVSNIIDTITSRLDTVNLLDTTKNSFAMSYAIVEQDISNIRNINELLTELEETNKDMKNYILG